MFLQSWEKTRSKSKQNRKKTKIPKTSFKNLSTLVNPSVQTVIKISKFISYLGKAMSSGKISEVQIGHRKLKKLYSRSYPEFVI